MNTGDKVIRMLAGTIPQEMVVRHVENGVVICDALQPNGSVFPGGWEFDEKTGAEIDEDLGWGPKFGKTGSFLKVEK